MEYKVGWSQAADLIFKIVEKHGSLPDFGSVLGDESGTLCVTLMAGFLNSYSMRYVGEHWSLSKTINMEGFDTLSTQLSYSSKPSCINGGGRVYNELPWKKKLILNFILI